MNKEKVAIIGCGNLANAAHIPAYMNNSTVEIAYFCDIILERAEKAVTTYGCGKAIKDYHDLLDDPELKYISVCTPNNVHAPIAIDFLRAGKHVLCEKPAARTLAEALSMQEAQHETGMTLNIGVVNRFNTGVNKIRELIEQGALGDVYHVYTSFRSHRSIPGLGGDFTTNAIAGGGALIDWGVHFLDIVMYCCGDPTPISASAEIFSKLGKDKDYTYVSMWAGPPVEGGTYDVEDSITGLVRTSGPTINVHGAWAQNIGEDEMFIDFMGDKGGIRLMYGGGFTYYSTANGMLTKTEYQYSSEEMFQHEINSFIEGVRTNTKLPSHIDTAVLTSKIMQAMYDSAEKHEEVKI